MIDLDTIVKCQKEGVDLLGTLTDAEKGKIDSICAFACPQIIQDAARQKAPVQKAVSDAFLFGISLGLKLRVVAGELQVR